MRNIPGAARNEYPFSSNNGAGVSNLLFEGRTGADELPSHIAKRGSIVALIDVVM